MPGTLREPEHPPEHLKLPVHAGYRQSRLLARGGEGGDVARGDGVEGEARQRLVGQQVLDAVLVEPQRLRPRRELLLGEGQELLLGELLERGHRQRVFDPDLPLCQLRLSRGFHLLGDAAVRLLR